MTEKKTKDGRQRVMIERVTPQIDGGRFAAKRIEGDNTQVEADIFVDGHDAISAVVAYRKKGSQVWREAPLEPIGNDRWRGEFPVSEIGRHEFTIEAWVDHFSGWRRDLAKKIKAGQDVSVDLLIGAELVEQAASRAGENDRNFLLASAAELRDGTRYDPAERSKKALDELLAEAVSRCPNRSLASRQAEALEVIVDRPLARFGAWYELFPRSTSPEAGLHGTFRDTENRLPYVASMGFDILYLPPIHPVGSTHRKGKNNAVTAQLDDPGSPWAIGGPEGGHTAIHPELGTLEDFHRLVAKAREHDIEIALDLAYQCTPDHPWVKDHPQWFRHRPDGTIQYAENPPKKYQDIYPVDFETDDWKALWEELKSVIYYWIDQGVRIFRVDNPHTKAFPFWENAISEVKDKFPDTIFLSEAFTRPKVRYRLAKLGFTQSYTYFAWRNTKSELTSYLTELTQTEVRDYFRPNFWPNTPDILTEYLQHGGRPAFLTRFVLAATMTASYGIYGPAYELCENEPRDAGGEEYLDSEKYEIRHRDLDQPHSLKELIARINGIRKANPALHSDWSLRFHEVDNDELICYSKQTQDLSNIVVVVVNLDPHHAHSGWVTLDLDRLKLDADRPYQVHDLLTGAHYLWHGARNYVQLDPKIVPAHIFHIQRRIRTERDFDYFM